MSENPNETPAVDLEEAEAQLLESLESAKRLVRRTKFLLSGEAETDSNYVLRGGSSA